MTLRTLLLLLLLPLLLACPTERGDDDDDAADDDDSAAVDDDDAMDDDDSGDDCFEGYDPTFDEGGCLDWDGASALCGFSSDDSVCELVLSCGMGTDLGQCSIDCEMMTTVACFDEGAVRCVVEATCAQDCDALAACNYFP